MRNVRAFIRWLDEITFFKLQGQSFCEADVDVVEHPGLSSPDSISPTSPQARPPVNRGSTIVLAIVGVPQRFSLMSVGHAPGTESSAGAFGRMQQDASYQAWRPMWLLWDVSRDAPLLQSGSQVYRNPSERL